MEQLERCLACRARLGEAQVCARCGTDFSISRRAQRQAVALTRLAVQELARGQTGQAATAAAAASHLANPLLAQVVARVVKRRKDRVVELSKETAVDGREVANSCLPSVGSSSG
jgi:hypothetical protein